MLPLSTMNVLGFSGMWFLRIIAAQAYYFMLAWHFIPEWQDRSSSRLWLTYKVTRAAVATSAVIALMIGMGSDDDYGEYYRTVSWAERGATFLELLLVTAWLSTHALWRRRTAEGIGLWLLAAIPIGLFRYTVPVWGIPVMALVYLMLLRSMNRTDGQAFWKWFRKKMDDIIDQGENGDTT